MKINFNEGGHILTFYWNSANGLLRFWFKPGWYRGGWEFELKKWFKP